MLGRRPDRVLRDVHHVEALFHCELHRASGVPQDVLQIPFLLNSDDFVFDSQVIVQATAFGFNIGEIGVPTRYFEEASSVNFRRSVVYGFARLWTLVKFVAHKRGVVEVPQFSKQLRDVISRYHRSELLRERREAG
mgnify:CR=1 FL=1